MTKTYKATGINLKSQVLGESDRIVTILTKEFGLVRAIAPSSRKHNSSLGGRIEMFVVNELLLSRGRSLDRITQAQTIKTYPGLSKDLIKLAASQYLAEIVLSQALSEHPQPELYELLNQYLQQLEALPKSTGIEIIAHLVHGVFDLLTLAGLTPEVQFCCLTQNPLIPDFTDTRWQVGFSIAAGGTVCLKAWENLKREREKSTIPPSSPENDSPTDAEIIFHHQELPAISHRLNAGELVILQYLSQPEIMQIDAAANYSWLSVERVLRHYTQYHLGRPIRSATLIDSYFAANHDATV